MKIRVFSLKKLNFILNFFTTFVFALMCVFLSFSIMHWTDRFGAYVETMSVSTSPVIVIDAGHGGEDVGAIGTNGVYEKDLNFEIAFLLGEILTEEGFTVFYTRTQDKLLYGEDENIKGMRKIYDLKNRAEIVNEKNPYMLISIHMNYFSIEKYSGFEVYYRTGDTDSQRLAYDVSSEVKLFSELENIRTPKATEELYILKNTSCPALLIECGFLSNKVECEKLCEKEYQKQLCFSIVCGIIKYESRKDY